jgi:hypothetical protein
MSSIVLDIGAKVIRAHIQNYLNINKYTDVNEFINDSSIVSEEMNDELKRWCFGNIPESLDGFDITKSFALIRNVIYKLDNSKFNYDRNKYKLCQQLKDIRNVKYAHLLAFEMDDVDFSVTVATLEEIIRQLCHFNKETSAKYLREVEDELEKDSSQLNRSDVIKLLAEQTQELQTFISELINSLSVSIDSGIQSLGEQLQVFISTQSKKDSFIRDQSQRDLFIQQIDEIKKYNEESRNLLFQVDMREFHEQTEITKRIDSTTSRIDSATSRIDSTTTRIETLIIDEIINNPHNPKANVIGLASNLPPPASKLYNREDEIEIFEKLAKYRMSCIAGMAGVGKSTLAITYGYHRIKVNEAKV